LLEKGSWKFPTTLPVFFFSPEILNVLFWKVTSSGPMNSLMVVDELSKKRSSSSVGIGGVTW